MLDIRIVKSENLKEKPQDENKLGFGTIFTDHMFVMNYNKNDGWHDARIVPYGDICLSPAAVVLHYGLEIFEGMKAYRWSDGSVHLFRPYENARRMINSADRMSLPPVEEEDFVQALKTLVAIESDWVPRSAGTSLYIRPTTICTNPDLSMSNMDEAMFFIILSPSGAFYKDGLKPVNILIEDVDARTVKGGTGEAKCGGNYAASMRATFRANDKGYSQVLWLDGAEKKYVEEVGSNNIMFLMGGKVVTPMLEGTVLPGITRKSCIQICREWGYEVEERRLPLAELISALEEGNVEEAFGVGTAAVVTPVGVLGYKGKDYEIGGGEIGKLTLRLYEELTGVQSGKIADTRGWTLKVE